MPILADPYRDTVERDVQQTNTGQHNETAASSYSYKLHAGEYRGNFIMIGEQNKEIMTPD
jgi:hypothetical protein